jgi:glucokinase
MKDVIEAVRAKDKVTQKYIQRAAKYIGRAIGQLINVINPEMIIINGDITLAGEVFLDPLEEEINKYAFRANNAAMKIISSNLGENAGLIGAASLVVRKIYKI